jgi:murein DD-endopeptidase MepM/ murein hydrolase activator NlpD
MCGTAYDPLRARAITVVDGRVRAFCSSLCKERSQAPLDEPTPAATVTPPPARGRPWLTATFVVVAGAGLGAGAKWVRQHKQPPPIALSVAAPPPPRPVALPPTRAQAMALLAPAPEESDTWIHPLYGPLRVLPIRNTRRFGAAREGLRPEECAGGHCGVDLGSVRGEPVLCAHDGVVERVVREDDGSKEGRFLRIDHKGGTVVTSYMHLDEIRADLKPGIPVKAGTVIGSVGETGVLHSGPHLHFAVSVRPSPDGPELFIDPEPMLHLWPLKDPSPAQKKLHARALASARNSPTEKATEASTPE